MLFTQALSDRCLALVRDRFAVFHIRLGLYQHFNEGDYNVIEDQRAAWNTWDAELAKAGMELTPGLILVNVPQCRIERLTFLYDVDFAGDRSARLHSLLNLLGKEAALSENPIRLGKDLDAQVQACIGQHPEVTQPEIWKGMNEQAKGARK